jgi:general stress protein 26
MGGSDRLIAGGHEEIGRRRGRGCSGPALLRPSPPVSLAWTHERTPPATGMERPSTGDDASRVAEARRAADRGDLAASATARRSAEEQRVTVELALRELRAHNFAVLSTVDEEGAPDAAGVTYGVSAPGRDLALYVMTRRHLKKARNIARDPRVALVVPLPRRVFRFVPPATIQLRGRAEILDWTDEEGTDVFRRFWLGRWDCA